MIERPEIFQDHLGRWTVGYPVRLGQPDHRVYHAKDKADAEALAALWPLAIEQKRRLLKNPWRLSSRTKKQERRRATLKVARQAVFDAARQLAKIEQR